MTREPFDVLRMPLRGLRLIEASAGTGKTFSLTGLFLRLLLEEKLAINQILVMTFTKAATQELRERIRKRLLLAARLAPLLDQPAQQAPEDQEQQLVLAILQQGRGEASVAALTQKLLDAANRIDEATIVTIHGFTQRAVAEHAFGSGLAFDRGEQTDDNSLWEEACKDYWRSLVLGEGASGGQGAALYAGFGQPKALYEALQPLLAKPFMQLYGPGLEAARHRIQAIWSNKQALCDELADALSTFVAAGGFRKNKLVRAVIGDPINPDQLIAELRQVLAAADPDYPRLPDWLVWVADPDNTDDYMLPKAEAAGVQPLSQVSAVRELGELHTLVSHLLLHQALPAVQTLVAERKQSRRLFSFNDMIQDLQHALAQPGTGDALAAALRMRWPWALVDEFQDTDPLQYEIFQRIYLSQAVPAAAAVETAAPSGLILIGDPKQAIYGFRGGDIFTYLAAAQAAGHCYSLDTNFRSTPALLAAVAQLFQQRPDAFVLDGIDFTLVQAGRAHQDKVLQRIAPDAAGTVPALHLWRQPPDAVKANKDEVLGNWTAACISQIKQLLDPAQHTWLLADGSQVPVRPTDIAILVNANREAAQIQRDLSWAGIPAVCIQRDNVYASEQAQELLLLLRAAAVPTDEDALRAALSTQLLGCRQQQLLELRSDEQAWQRWLDEMQQAHERWQRHGVLAMLEPLLQRALPALQQLVDGERRLSNYLQLGELLQTAQSHTYGQSGLISYLNTQMLQAASGGTGVEADVEATQLRLESEADLVRIATVHAVKGLQFPIVFMPVAAWMDLDNKVSNPPWAYHERGAAWLDTKLDGNARQHQAQAIREKRAELMRVFYVAVTRAEQQLYLGWDAVKDASNSALAWLLHQEQQTNAGEKLSESKDAPNKLTPERVSAVLERLCNNCEHINIQTLPLPAASTSAPAVPTQDTQQLRQDLPAPKPIWSIYSFSRLVRGGGRAEPVSGADDEVHAPLPVAATDLLDQMRGPGFGSALHDMLQEILQLLEPADWFTQPDAMQQTIARHLRRQGQVLADTTQWQTLLEQVAGLLARTLQTPLPGIGPLQALPPQARRAEMEFFLRLSGCRLQQMLQLLQDAGYTSFTPENLHWQIRGMMQGFVDLIVRSEAGYFVLDYKSNYLGPTLADYGDAALQGAIAHGHYDIQFLIYSLALHRYLRERLPNYQLERDFGGVHYLFLRGMNGRDCSTGVYSHRPAAELLLALEQLLVGTDEH